MFGLGKFGLVWILNAAHTTYLSKKQVGLHSDFGEIRILNNQILAFHSTMVVKRNTVKRRILNIQILKSAKIQMAESSEFGQIYRHLNQTDGVCIGL